MNEIVLRLAVVVGLSMYVGIHIFGLMVFIKDRRNRRSEKNKGRELYNKSEELLKSISAAPSLSIKEEEYSYALHDVCNILLSTNPENTHIIMMNATLRKTIHVTNI